MLEICHRFYEPRVDVPPSSGRSSRQQIELVLDAYIYCVVVFISWYFCRCSCRLPQWPNWEKKLEERFLFLLFAFTHFASLNFPFTAVGEGGQKPWRAQTWWADAGCESGGFLRVGRADLLETPQSAGRPAWRRCSYSPPVFLRSAGPTSCLYVCSSHHTLSIQPKAPVSEAICLSVFGSIIIHNSEKQHCCVAEINLCSQTVKDSALTFRTVACLQLRVVTSRWWHASSGTYMLFW